MANAEPNLAVADGQVTSTSGIADVAGQNLVVALGYGGWGPADVPTSDGNKWQNKAGTFMHELGHNMGHTHGGTFYNNFKPLANPPVIDYTPTFEVNCKANVQTSMNYLFQFDLMQVPGQTNAAGKPLMVVDYSEDDGSVPTLTESQPQGPGILTNLPYANSAPFQLPTNNSGAPHCNGSPLAVGEKSLTYVQFSRSDFFWSAPPFPGTGEDINFDGNTTDVMHAHNEWTGTPAEGGVGRLLVLICGRSARSARSLQAERAVGIFRVAQAVGIFRVAQGVGIFRVAQGVGIFRVALAVGIFRAAQEVPATLLTKPSTLTHVLLGN